MKKIVDIKEIIEFTPEVVIVEETNLNGYKKVVAKIDLKTNTVFYKLYSGQAMIGMFGCLEDAIDGYNMI